jgi:UDP-2-acetamido-3-amino-2,3-dideoxy-glucuronate N-acetyltransferase
MIGAGAVVTKNVPAYALMVGNPAKRIGWVSEAGITLRFNDKGEAQCPQSKRSYKLSGKTLLGL